MNRRNFLKGLLATATIAVIPSPLTLPGYGVAQAATFDELIAKSLKSCQKLMLDNITRPSPLYLMLKDKGLLQPASGKEIWERIR